MIELIFILFYTLGIVGFVWQWETVKSKTYYGHKPMVRLSIAALIWVILGVVGDQTVIFVISRFFDDLLLFIPISILLSIAIRTVHQAKRKINQKEEDLR